MAVNTHGGVPSGIPRRCSTNAAGATSWPSGGTSTFHARSRRRRDQLLDVLMTLTHSLKALIRDLPGIGPAVTQLRLMTLSPSDRRAYEQNIRYDRETLLVMERVLQP